MSRLLEGNAVLITGGTQGVGLGMAESFLAAGAQVAVVGRDSDKLQRALRHLEPLGPVTGVATDISVVANIQLVLDEVMSSFGRLDVLANVAGVFRPGSFLDVSEDDFDYQMRINVRAMFFVTQAAARLMLSTAGRGKVINISSTAGQRPYGGVSVYCTSKAAVDHLTRVMAAELAPLGINVNCIVPGNIEMPTNTLMQAPGAAEATAAATPARRNGRPEDIGAGAVFLASDSADFMHGSALVIDGGSSLNSG